MHDIVADLLSRVLELERRVASSVRHGVVTDVDTEKKRVRLRIGGTTDAPFLSPWVPYSQIAGALKLHSPPSKKQQMTLLAAAGDYPQAVAIPTTWSDENKSPSDKEDEHVLTFGKHKITLKDATATWECGDSKLTISKDSIEAKNSNNVVKVDKDRVTANVDGKGYVIESDAMKWSIKAIFKGAGQPINGNSEAIA